MRWGATATSFGISPFNAVRCVVPALYWEGMARSCSSSDLSIVLFFRVCSVAAAARFAPSDARARRVAKGLFVDSTQTPHTSSHAPEVVGL